MLLNHNRKIKKFFAALAGALALTACSLTDTSSVSNKQAQVNSDKKQSNVLIIMFDDMRFDTFSYRNGPVNTPNIDNLAAQSVRFDNAMTTTGLCSPSRAAFFTGRWGHKTGLDDNLDIYRTRLFELNPNEGGLIRRAKDAGFYTGFVGKWHLGHQGVALRGADYISDDHEHHAKRFQRTWVPYSTESDILAYKEGKLGKNGEKTSYYQTLPGTYETSHTAHLVHQAEEMMKQAKNSGKPFFGVASFHQPHPPYRVPEPYASMFDPNKIKLPPNFMASNEGKPLGQNRVLWPWHDVSHMTEMDWRKAHSFYYGAIAMVDRVVGELIQSAKENGLYEDLTIVLVGDQGSMLGEHGLFDKMPYAYDELMRIPLLIKAPGTEPKIVTRQVSLIDVAPTLGELLSLPNDGDVDGHSLLPLMEKGDVAEAGQPDTALYAYEWYNGAWYGIKALRTPEFKFVWNPGESVDEFYDLKNDPYEMTNLIKSEKHKAQIAEHVKMLDAELARTEDPSLEKFRIHFRDILK
ncbi:sulfatase [Catenovulum agarivorans DS-2]|uniref:Sulfatase n=1 Tax=Catenovulum agarivorans DS-2 TaxID=1328313 RepID=W7QKV3_9ALTE|nr:sulfatase-like hydrolase/transferase [Catenovulum agarivorans]EWH09572.1 sulfatase [Catenovulum agarivorans DS-2]